MFSAKPEEDAMVEVAHVFLSFAGQPDTRRRSATVRTHAETLLTLSQKSEENEGTVKRLKMAQSESDESPVVSLNPSPEIGGTTFPPPLAPPAIEDLASLAVSLSDGTKPKNSETLPRQTRRTSKMIKAEEDRELFNNLISHLVAAAEHTENEGMGTESEVSASASPNAIPAKLRAKMQTKRTLTKPNHKRKQVTLAESSQSIASSSREGTPEISIASKFRSKKEERIAIQAAETLSSTPGSSLVDVFMKQFTPLPEGAKKKRLKCGKMWIIDPTTAEKLFICPGCTKTYGTSNGLKYHLSHHDPSDFPPGYYYRSIKPREQSTDISHDDDQDSDDGDETNSVEQDAYACVLESECKKRYSTLGGLRYHMRNVHGMTDVRGLSKQKLEQAND